MKNTVPKMSLTCLVAKATLDESMLWHRRLGHVNFKTINKLVKDNLVRGLPSKHFENDQTCVACLKGKQHKASCKSKIQNSITQPLFMLHMDLFGPTFVSSLMNKKYCLVVTDDYSRFTWVFFLATKDETSGILKSFITEIENLVDKKVKIIRCDNGTEFKNRVMSEFCEKKGIKREFSVARTPQQNGVAERRNRTLIEAARTMLADSKLPTTFWAEVVNTACYVQNRVLVVKPHNKTPYELFRGRTPALSFMRPFGCHVTILNTLDYLGKFDCKSDDGFFIGYSLNSKAFRVYNIRTWKVEENLHIRFLEDKPIITGDGPKWLFDIDILTKSMNYVPVVADSSLFDSSSKNASNDEPQPSSDAGKKDDDGVSKESGIDDQEKPKNNSQDINTTKPKVDMSNITNTYLVPSTPNTRIYKDHSLDHVIGDEELLQFKLQKVWVLVDLPKGNRAIGFMVYQMDVKSAFLYGYIEEEVYVDDIIFGSTKELCSEFEKLMHDKFQMSYMGELTFFLELQVNKKEDGIFISQDKYVAKILRKFCFTDIRTASTPMDTKKPLLKDSDGDDVDVHINRSMIGSLMYLTSSRPDIMFACKKQTVDATSSTEAEYVATASFYGQKPVGSDEFQQIVDFLNASHIRYALTANPTIYVSLIKQFWQTTTAKTLDNGEIEITATIDGTVKTVTEASIRRHLQLADADGISSLPTTKIFEQISLMGAQLFRVKDQHTQLSPITHPPVLHQPHNHQFHKQLGELSDRNLWFLCPDLLLKTLELMSCLMRRSRWTRFRGGMSMIWSLILSSYYKELYNEKGVSTAEPVSTVGASAEIDEEERHRIARVHKEASSFNTEEWDDIQARVEADEEFAQRLQSEEKEMYTVAEKERLLV
ncbi:putative ribonuclease H-like domain-containing protein [Tanacetum coccineum]